MQNDFPSYPLKFVPRQALQEELAYFGGYPVIPKQGRKTIYPHSTKEDLLNMLVAVQKKPNQVIDHFTEAYRTYVGAPYAISTSSGTSSLHLALVGVGVEPGDEVIIPAFTFIATAQAVVAAKAIPIFVDIDPKTFCIDPCLAKQAITSKTRAIMPVHVHGLPADMLQISDLCLKHKLKLVEDASHAHSASINGKICGSFGDAAGQSLMADKNFPVGGEGGIAFFREFESYERAKKFTQKNGIDYRMSWLCAAYGHSQLLRLPYYDAVRQRNAEYLSNALKETKLFRPPYVPQGFVHAYNMYRILLSEDVTELSSIPIHQIKWAIQSLLVAEGVPVREWQNKPIPGHLPFQNKIGFGSGYPFTLSQRKDFGYCTDRFPNTLKMLETSVVLCREMRSPIEKERVEAYAIAFQKVSSRLDAIRDLSKLARPLPYQRDARLG
jgi:dTDP-4-amino-4,6-dideoxygalactose transaminase